MSEKMMNLFDGGESMCVSEMAEKVQEHVLSCESLDEKISTVNKIKQALHDVSPFKEEPVDCVMWIKAEHVKGNDYNPNSVAPPEMELLEHSIDHDGFTQPVVGWDKGDGYEVVDGFHRTTVAQHFESVKKRLHGYLPVVSIQGKNSERNDRVASTIRHNRARGKHKVESMSDIVIELKKRNWTDNRIGKELGMDADEVLRLCQITGLSEVFSDESFSQSWDAVIMDEEKETVIDETDIEALDNDESHRIFHEWEDWECYPAGFYADKPPKGMTVEECEESYRAFLADIPRFESALQRVITEWKNSCEHYLTNEKMNRIAWLGQASMCIDSGIPSRFCGGYNHLTDEEKDAADRKAHEYLNMWLKQNGRAELTWEEAKPKTKANIY